MKRLYIHFRDWYAKRDLQKKLMILFSSLFMILLLFFGSSLFANIVADSREQLLYSARQAHQQALAFLSNKIDLALYASDVIYYDLSVHRLILTSVSQPKDLGNEFRDFFTVWTNLKNFQSDAICNICLFLGKGSTYVDQRRNFDSFDTLQQTDRFKVLLASGKSYAWSDPWELQLSARKDSRRVVSLLRLIRSLDDYNSLLSAVQISLEADKLDAIVQYADITEGGLTFVLNSGGALIAASDTASVQRLGSPAEVSALYEQALDGSTATLDGHSFIGLSSAVPNTDWKLITLLPSAAVYASGRSAMTVLLLYGVPVLLLGVFFIWLLSRSFGRRVHGMAMRMESVQKGNLDVVLEETPPDELGRLGRTFNYMLGEIRKLMRQQYESGKYLKQAELKALQAQINPHFLYNTLDLINWRALDRGADDIAALTQTMGRYYRLSLSKGQDFVKIRNELEHLTLYVRIQNYRFDNRICLETEIPEQILELEIMKLVLQPLVENAVLHGVNWENSASRLVIRITGTYDGGDVLLTVSDNGVGIDENVMATVLAETAGKEARGYGLRNIHQRLKLCYGEAYGLAFTRLNGTLVRVRIPAQPMKNI